MLQCILSSKLIKSDIIMHVVRRAGIVLVVVAVCWGLHTRLP